MELIAISLAALAEVFGQQLASWIISVFDLQVGSLDFAGRHFTSREVTTSLASYVIPAFIMVIAILMFTFRLLFRQNHFWRAQRALAEATKGLAWRYSMRAMNADLHAGVPLDMNQSHQAFQKDLDKLLRQAESLRLPPPKPGEPMLPQTMDTLRFSPLADQREAYKTARLENQRDWYAKKANTYRNWSIYLQTARFVVYGLGIALIFFTGFGSNGLGAMTTIAGAVATWLAGKHYDDLAQSYGSMARELDGMTNVIPDVSAPPQGSPTDIQDTWSMFVDKVETLLNGEHQDWLRNTK
ncbi:MAG TPA: SLATT domain-containing protein [Ktedonobacterales bacterium]|nr:SLATT domain-containing protein [Ktedonobacterales bacterium]